MRRLLVLSLSLWACDDRKPQAPAQAAAPLAAPTKSAVDAFHDVLAPVWHTDDQPQQTEKACAALPDFRAQVTRLVTEAPPPVAALPPPLVPASTPASLSAIGPQVKKRKVARSVSRIVMDVARTSPSLSVPASICRALLGARVE